MPEYCRHDIVSEISQSPDTMEWLTHKEVLTTLAICGPLKYCPRDLCIVMDVKCPLTHSCQKGSFCNPIDGKCNYIYHENGHPCDDGLYYTNNDTCFDMDCVGKE